MNICLENLCVNFDDKFQIKNVDWQISTGQHWMLVGANGAGKSALAATLCGYGDILSGSIVGLPANVGIVSHEVQTELIAQELKKDDADILDVISEGTTASEMLARDCTNQNLKHELVEAFAFTPLMDHTFLSLSSGETRKLLLIRALANEPDLLVLDEPFSGLDVDSTATLQKYLKTLTDKTTMVLVLNRLDLCPEFITNIAYLQNGQLSLSVSRDNKQAYSELYTLLHLKTTGLEIPTEYSAHSTPALDPAQPLVRIKNATIAYGDVDIFSGLNWTIEPNQHWQLSGPNGSGKTSLLSLITGDHPQCYTNDIFVFGYQRGSGESIWQIKQFIGFVSNALHLQYRVSISVRNVIISGFYDSIGLYSQSTPKQLLVADQWLMLLGMKKQADRPFSELSYGEQRMLLIARAMVKQPPLLILDEPCSGLDEMNRQLVLALIEKICAGNTTSVIYVSHHAEDIIEGIDNYLSLEPVV